MDDTLKTLQAVEGQLKSTAGAVVAPAEKLVSWTFGGFFRSFVPWLTPARAGKGTPAKVTTATQTASKDGAPATGAFSRRPGQMFLGGAVPGLGSYPARGLPVAGQKGAGSAPASADALYDDNGRVGAVTPADIETATGAGCGAPPPLQPPRHFRIVRADDGDVTQILGDIVQ